MNSGQRCLKYNMQLKEVEKETQYMLVHDIRGIIPGQMSYRVVVLEKSARGNEEVFAERDISKCQLVI